MADQSTKEQKDIKATFKCDVCQTIHSKQDDYNNHMLGNKHKRKVAMKTADIQNKARKQLYETKGVFIGNLPPNTMPNELQAYVGLYGNVEKSTFGSRFAKFLFADEQSAASFKKRKHVFKGHMLRVSVWQYHAPVSWGPKPDDGGSALQGAVDKALAPSLDPDREVGALLGALLATQRPATSARLCSDLATALRPVCSDFSVHPFGSTLTGLAFQGSDLDVVVDNTFTLLEYGREGRAERQSFRIDRADMKAVARALGKFFRRVVPVYGARVPVIKCVHRATELSCDLSFTNVTAVQNSQLICWYLSLDARVKPLLVILKYWAKFFELTKTCFTNYALVMMGLFYLMQLDDPIVPPVIHLQRTFAGRLYVDGWNCTFDPNHHFQESKNTSSIFELLLGFFKFYARFDYGMNVVCPLLGKALPKVFFRHVKQLPSELTSYQLNPQDAEERLTMLKIESCMCVQDPFILDCNITKSIPQVAALRIQAICLSSAYVLNEDSKDGTTGLLKHLLQKRTDDLTLVSSLWNSRKLPGNNFEIQIVVGSCVPIVGPEATLNDARDAWYNKVFAVIMNIFENIFKFKIEEDLSSVDTQNTEITDVNYSRTIICKSKGPDLRTNRKQIGKELLSDATDSAMSFLEMQERITQHMMAQVGSVETVEFKCCFYMRKDPTHIILELSDVASSERVFGLWASYLAAHLGDWSRMIMDAEKETSEMRESTTASA